MKPPKKVINYVSTNDIVGRKFVTSNVPHHIAEFREGMVYTVVRRVFKEGGRTCLRGLEVIFDDRLPRSAFFSIENCYQDVEVSSTQPPQTT